MVCMAFGLWIAYGECCKSSSSCRLHNQFSPLRERVLVVVLVLERRPQARRAGVVPANAGRAHREAHTVAFACLRHGRFNADGRSCRAHRKVWRSKSSVRANRAEQLLTFIESRQPGTRKYLLSRSAATSSGSVPLLELVGLSLPRVLAVGRFSDVARRAARTLIRSVNYRWPDGRSVATTRPFMPAVSGGGEPTRAIGHKEAPVDLAETRQPHQCWGFTRGLQ